MSPEAQRNYERYMAAMHAVQSAVLTEIGIEGVGMNASAGPKHLRTGINACLVDNRAILGLLIKKGLLAEDEYLAALADAAEEEQRMMTERLRKKTGRAGITFG